MFKDDEEREYVIAEISTAIGREEYPRTTLLAPFITTDFPSQNLESGLTPRDLVMKVVKVCLGDQWNSKPSWLESLLTPFARNNSKIMAIVQRLQMDPPPSANPFKKVILNDSRPFINRVAFRSQLMAFATQPATPKPVIVVTGNTKSGKSYSSRYVEHFSNIKVTIIPSKFEFDPDLVVDMTVENIAQTLVFRATGQLLTLPSQATNNIRAPYKIAEWVLNESFKTSSEQVWFILDNFKGAKLSPVIRDFIVSLSVQITQGVQARKFKLILIDFDKEHLTIDDSRYDEDIIGECKEAEILAAISEIKSYAAFRIDDEWLTNFVFQNLKEGENKMSELNIRLRELIYVIQRIKMLEEEKNEGDYEKLLKGVLKDLPSGEAGINELKKRI